jgi:hypothetical protein
MQYRRLASWKGVVMVGCTGLDWWQEKQYARKVGEKKLLFPFFVVRCCWAAVLVLASFTMILMLNHDLNGAAARDLIYRALLLEAGQCSDR